MTEDLRLKDKRKVRAALVCTEIQTHGFASVRAILIVDLYPPSCCMKLTMASPMYLNLGQSRKVVWLSPDREEHSSSNTLQELPHRSSKGRSREDSSTSVVALTVSVSEPKRSYLALTAKIVVA